MSIDYGIKRCGLAVTDPMQIIVTPLKTIKSSTLLSFIETYTQEEEVEKIVFGFPTHRDGNPTYIVAEIEKVIRDLKTINGDIEFDFQNENYSSKEALEIIQQSGLTKKQRQDKSRIDRISAVIILQRYLKHI